MLKMRLIRRFAMSRRDWYKNILFVYVVAILKIVDAMVIVFSLGTLMGEFEIEYLMSEGTRRIKCQTK